MNFGLHPNNQLVDYYMMLSTRKEIYINFGLHPNNFSPNIIIAMGYKIEKMRILL